MKKLLHESSGFPLGSTAANLDFLEFDNREWEKPLHDIEATQVGGARTSLEFFDHQRIFRKDDVSIVYEIVNIGSARVIYLGALTTYERMIPDMLWKMINMRP
jgi:hypothetical protein